jgi:hypothetical protein
MNQVDAWKPVLQFLVDQGYELPSTVQITVEGHKLTVEVPEELQAESSS